MGEKKTILVVDDVSQIRTILRFNLEKEGYNVIDANSGERALEYAVGENIPDLIILDIMMPKMDGYEVIRKLRESDVTKHIPVIFLTAKAQKKDVLKGIEAGGNDYVVKPFKFADVHRKIKELTGMDIQNEFLEYNKDKKKADQILVRIGIHIGDILIRDNDVFGTGVNVASRIEPLAEPGGICISADAYNVVKKSIDIKVLSLGKKELKNIEDPPEIFKILIE